MPKPKHKIEENKLLKALSELEGVAKGDPLEDADPEGGLSTEGAPLSDAAPSGRAEKTKKSRSRSTSSSSASSVEKGGDDESADDAAKAFSASDMGSDVESEPPKKKKSKKKVKKSTAKALPAASSSSDDESSDDGSDDESSDDESTEKAMRSFRERADGDETMSKAIEVSDFIEAMVDQIGVAFADLGRKLTKSIQDAEQRLAARIDNRVAKSMGASQAFNARLATAVAAIGNAVQDEVVDVVKSLANQPAGNPRGRAVLSKAEVNQPPWGGTGGGSQMADGSGDDDVAQLSEIPSDKIGDWLFRKSTLNQIDPQLILAWEADRYNVEALPMQVRKALANDLIK